jgi:hypothetical protein
MEEQNKQTHKVPKEMKDKVLSFIADEFVKGYSLQVIADKLEAIYNVTISKTMVYKYIEKVKAEWYEARLESIERLKAIELQRIGKLEATAWDGWERSLRKKTRKAEKKRLTSGGSGVAEGGDLTPVIALEPSESSTVETEGNGDPRFLAMVMTCIQMRCRILGVEAPVEFKGNVVTEMRRKIVVNTHQRPAPVPSN